MLDATLWQSILPVYLVPRGRFKRTITLPCNYRYESNGTVNVTMNVSFPSRIIKQRIYFIVSNEIFFHIQPVVANVTMSVSFPSRIIKQIIYFCV
jgi:hypothetical protein